MSSDQGRPQVPDPVSDSFVTDTPLDMGTDEPRLIHWYPTRGRRPVAGDRAYCGRLKTSPTHWPTKEAALASGVPVCVVCEDLRHA